MALAIFDEAVRAWALRGSCLSRPMRPSAMMTGMPVASGVKPWDQARRRWSIEFERLPT